MAKKKIITPNSELEVFGASESGVIPQVVGATCCGSQVLVEILTQQEMAGTILTLSEKTDLKVPLQGYVRGIGPSCKSADFGFKVGDRVLISGSGVKAPNYDKSHRDRYFMEPHAIKSVLIES